MGLDDFSSGDSDSSSDDDDWEDDWDSSSSDESEDEEEATGDSIGDDEFPSPDVMGNILYHHALNKSVDIEVDGRELKGDAEDFGMLFALMFLDYPDADPYSLEDPR